MSVRTYNPSVLIGNWNEDICLEEVIVLKVLYNFELSDTVTSSLEKCCLRVEFPV